MSRLTCKEEQGPLDGATQDAALQLDLTCWAGLVQTEPLTATPDSTQAYHPHCTDEGREAQGNLSCVTQQSQAFNSSVPKACPPLPRQTSCISGL